MKPKSRRAYAYEIRPFAPRGRAVSTDVENFWTAVVRTHEKGGENHSCSRVNVSQQRLRFVFEVHNHSVVLTGPTAYMEPLPY